MGLDFQVNTVSTSAVTTVHTCAHFSRVLLQVPASGTVYYSGSTSITSSTDGITLSTSMTDPVTIHLVAGDVLYAIGSSSSVVFNSLAQTAG
jgi:hypothetical protein